jgi:hypothetical protein
MSRNYFDADDSRNFCSLVKEAKKYSKNNANKLREHYETKGILTAFATIAVSYGLPKFVKFMTAETKIERIMRGEAYDYEGSSHSYQRA